MAHLLELFETLETPAPSCIILIDFGAAVFGKIKSKVPELEAAPAVATVVNSLLEKQKIGLTPKLDYVLISHQDTDHWSLLYGLMEAVEKIGLEMKVGEIFRGGSDWGPSAIDAINKLKKFGDGGDAPDRCFTTHSSDYEHPNGTLGNLVSIDDFVLRVLLSNAVISSKAPSMRKNGTSTVVVVDYADARTILPGDATCETLAACNKLLEAWDMSPVRPVNLISVPHHGALATMTPSKNKDKESDLETLKKFTELVQPEAIVASAGHRNSHHHPYRIILETLGQYAAPSEANKGLGQHKVVMYDLALADWQLYDTQNNIYTTVLSLTSPVTVADYFFTRFGAELFKTEIFAFDALTEAAVSVPSTSPQVLHIEMANATGTGTRTGTVKSTGVSSWNGRDANRRLASAPIARPRLRSIFAPPPPLAMAPVRRVSPVMSALAS